MLAEEPEIAGLRDRLFGRFGDEVGVDEGLGEGIGQPEQLGQLVRLPQVREVDVLGDGGQDLLIPLGQFGSAVVEEREAGLLLRRESTPADGDEFGAVGLDDAEAFDADLLGRLHGGVAGQDGAGLVDHDRAGGADLRKGLLDLGQVAGGVAAGITGIGGEVGTRARPAPLSGLSASVDS